MQRLEVSGAVRPIYGSLGAKGLTAFEIHEWIHDQLRVQVTVQSVLMIQID
jgi:hypothetical protein